MILLEVCRRNRRVDGNADKPVSNRRTITSFKQLSQRNSQSAYAVPSSQTQTTLIYDFCRPSGLDVQFVDFDGVRFHMATPNVKTTIVLSMHIRCWNELAQFGALDVLKREYGGLLAPQPEPEYNVSLEIDLTQAPPEGGACAAQLCYRVFANFHTLCRMLR